MPFTLAHPAAAVPLARVLGRWGVLSAPLRALWRGTMAGTRGLPGAIMVWCVLWRFMQDEDTA
jgi:uncharacterized protein DUF4184